MNIKDENPKKLRLIAIAVLIIAFGIAGIVAAVRLNEQKMVAVDVILLPSTEIRCAVHSPEQQVLVLLDQTVKVTQYPEDQLKEVSLLTLKETDQLLETMRVSPENVSFRLLSFSPDHAPDRSVISDAFRKEYRIPKQWEFYAWVE